MAEMEPRIDVLVIQYVVITETYNSWSSKQIQVPLSKLDGYKNKNITRLDVGGHYFTPNPESMILDFIKSNLNLRFLHYGANTLSSVTDIIHSLSNTLIETVYLCGAVFLNSTFLDLIKNLPRYLHTLHIECSSYADSSDESNSSSFYSDDESSEDQRGNRREIEVVNDTGDNEDKVLNEQGIREATLLLDDNITLTCFRNDDYDINQDLRLESLEDIIDFGVSIFNDASYVPSNYDLALYYLSRNAYIQKTIRNSVIIFLMSCKYGKCGDCVNYDVGKIIGKYLYASRNEVIWKRVIPSSESLKHPK